MPKYIMKRDVATPDPIPPITMHAPPIAVVVVAPCITTVLAAAERDTSPHVEREPANLRPQWQTKATIKYVSSAQAMLIR